MIRYKVGVYIGREGPVVNGVSHPTRAAAESAGTELLSRWTQPDRFEVIEVNEIRSLATIAREIRQDAKGWGGPGNFAAVPYLQAMSQLDTIDQSVWNDQGSHIVAYFLSNASQWRGDTARRVKAELRAMLKSTKGAKS